MSRATTGGPPHLVLVGLMGAGKTTVGERCASRLDRSFVDTDDLVAATAHRSVAEIFASEGEASFRALERQAIVDACASPRPLVIACGGGAAVDPENRRRLRARGFVVWLQAPVPVLAARVGTDPGRPLLAGDPEGALDRLAGLREESYRAAAHAAVDTGRAGADEVADAVLTAYVEGTA